MNKDYKFQSLNQANEEISKLSSKIIDLEKNLISKEKKYYFKQITGINQKADVLVNIFIIFFKNNNNN